MKSKTKNIFAEAMFRNAKLQSCADDVERAFEALKECFAGGGTLYLCGNGGSAADCAHIVGELVKSFRLPRPLPLGEQETLAGYGEEGACLARRLQAALPAVSLCEQTALSTAFLNDVEGKYTYAQLAYAFARKGDVLLCISTSGNAINCYCAALAAKSKGARVLALTGAAGGKLREVADVCIRVPENETYLVQELHLPVYHCLCAMLEEEFFGGSV